MENLPDVTATARLPLQIPIPPHLHDHRVDGRSVLPGVEALCILARAVRRFRPATDVTCMRGVVFDKFLALDRAATHLSAFADLSRNADGSVTAKLETKAGSKHGLMTRVKTHVAVTFGGATTAMPDFPLDLAAAPEGVCLRIEKDRVYPGLVGFGPWYQNLSGLHLSEHGVVAGITTPVAPDAGPDASCALGSPFALDAALHAACIWGQRFAGIVPFPVGMDRRRILVPTRPGEPYVAHVLPVGHDAGVMNFDLRLYDGEGRLREVCAGVRMRDVSAGRMRPPEWVRSGGEPSAPGRLTAVCRALAVIELGALAPFAERALSERERGRLAGMRGRRRASFTAARLACKRVSRRLSGGDVHTPAERITTLRAERPQLPACPPTDGRGAAACSVAHDRRFAIAVAAEGRVGVDVETLSERLLRCRTLYMSAAEEALVRESPLGETEAAVRVWSVKEAVAKALDIALAECWGRVEATEIGRGESRFRVDRGDEKRAVHDEVGPHVFTLVGGASLLGL